MFYMNKTKRNLIMAAAIINIVFAVLEFVASIVLVFFAEEITLYLQQILQSNDYVLEAPSMTYTLLSGGIPFLVSVVGSILLIFSVREKGKYFRSSRGLYVTGFIMTVICGSFVAWILLFISIFVADIVVMNSASEVRREEKMEQKEQEKAERLKEQAYQAKKQKIEDLKVLRDNGVITEEEYKKKLFEIL